MKHITLLANHTPIAGFYFMAGVSRKKGRYSYAAEFSSHGVNRFRSNTIGILPIKIV
ncbi:hypothetical protein NOC27_46 [Nitrosococcus oceani AFC27]|nr:hypothetical protein NOC27_46 [Nitrosococcus oceani AFC27]